MSNVAEQVIQRHTEVKNEGIPEGKHPDQLHVIARHHRLQLSIAMLCDAIGPERAVSIHEDFMYRHIAELKDPPRFHGSYRNCDMDKTLCWTISKDQVIK